MTCQATNLLSGKRSLVQVKHQARQNTISASGDHRGMSWLAIWLGLGSALLNGWTTAEGLLEEFALILMEETFAHGLRVSLCWGSRCQRGVLAREGVGCGA